MPTPKGDSIDLADRLASFGEHWSPRVVAEMNDVQFKLVKLLLLRLKGRLAESDDG